MNDKKEDKNNNVNVGISTMSYEEFLKIREQAIDKLRYDPNFRIIIDDSKYYTDE